MFVDIIDHSFRIVRKNRSTYFYIPKEISLHFSSDPAVLSGSLQDVDINLTDLLAKRFPVLDEAEKEADIWIFLKCHIRSHRSEKWRSKFICHPVGSYTKTMVDQMRESNGMSLLNESLSNGICILEDDLL